jgi:hypothetical protein
VSCAGQTISPHQEAPEGMEEIDPKVLDFVQVLNLQQLLKTAPE